MKSIKGKLIKNFIRLLGIIIVVGVISHSDITLVKAAKFKISKTSITLSKGKKKKLKVKNLPKANAKVKWSTSNKYAVTVSKKGKIKAVNYGTAVITAVCKKKKATCTVTVPDDTKKVTLNTDAVTLLENTSYQLTAKALETVSYHSENESIATVDVNGLINALNPGIVTITAKTTTGYAKCTVTVEPVQTQSEETEPVIDKKETAIRRLTKNDNLVYDNIAWAKGKDIRFKIANLDVEDIKKCVWSSSDTNILSKPVKSDDSKIQASAKTLNPGTAKITAKVTYNSGKVKTYTNYVYVSSPSISTKELMLLGETAGSNRQQFVSLSGLSEYSKIKWSNSNPLCATYSEYGTKAAVWGISDGMGTLKATVDGKTFKINYTVKCPVFSELESFVIKGKTDTIKIDGIEEMPVEFFTRNSSVATVTPEGVVKGINPGVTYVDVHIGTMNFSYRVEVAAKGMKKIIKRAKYIVNNWKYSQKKRMKKGYYDCSALVWKGYKAYKKYQKKLGSATRALSSADLFDYLYSKGQIVYFGYAGIDNLQPGDLIFYGDYNNACIYSTPGRTLNIYHVSMYAGGGEVVEKGGKTIDYNGTKYIVGIGRVVE